MRFLVQLVLRVLTAIPRAVLRTLQGWVTGRDAILDVEVVRMADSVARHQFLQRLRALGQAKGVSAVLLRLRETPGGWASCQDLAAVIRELKDKGTPVYAQLEQGGNALMWLAAGCDHVFLVPTGEVALVGMGAEMMFFGSALKKLGVEPDFEAAGAYKSFGEPYTRSFASQANQEATQALLSSLHEQLLGGIAAGRTIEREKLEETVANSPISGPEAIDAGLVDRLAYEDEVVAWLEEHHGEKSRLVEFRKMSSLYGARRWLLQLGDMSPTMAVLHLEGPIVMEGSGSGPYIQGRKVAREIRRLREDDGVAAVVLCVNSPGGSALASDVMWREVDLLRREKPVVAAFEDVAASGGYYLAAPAAEIVARGGTLTGSIGVFGGKLVMGEGLRRVGVHVQQMSVAPNANLYSPSRRFTDAQRIRFRGSLQRFYDGFVHRVASGRRRPIDQVEPHCRGRVWTGEHAIELGLVDRIGDLDVAVERARALTGLRDGGYRRVDVVVERRRMLLNKLRGRLIPGAKGAGVLQHVLRSWFGGLPVGMEQSLHVLASHQGRPLAMLPFHWFFR